VALSLLGHLFWVGIGAVLPMIVGALLYFVLG
jgi:hypothetical protein